MGTLSPLGWWLGLAPATLEFWVRFPNEKSVSHSTCPPLSPSTREQLCHRYCSNQYTQANSVTMSFTVTTSRTQYPCPHATNSKGGSFSSDFVENRRGREGHELRSGAGSRDRRCAPLPAYPPTRCYSIAPAQRIQGYICDMGIYMWRRERARTPLRESGVYM